MAVKAVMAVMPYLLSCSGILKLINSFPIPYGSSQYEKLLHHCTCSNESTKVHKPRRGCNACRQHKNYSEEIKYCAPIVICNRFDTWLLQLVHRSEHSLSGCGL